MFGNPFAAHPQSVSSRRGPIYRARIYVFATHSQSVQNTFTECSQRVRFLYVTYSHYKSMVFAVQKYGFWRAKRGFLSYKSMVFVFWMLHCCKLFATHSPNVATLLLSVRHAFAECLPHCCNSFATYSQSVSSAFASVRHVVAIRQQRIRPP